ncbi:ribosomal protein S27/S33, mitochondrial [Ophiocordyceps camponoti-floridani]|uniref:Small ribosomal subunit protein mS33 n=1 Tax=Ophiocordyceps camponoti-floridani TaxID=2030778 RepID=A0A8H4Q9B0_9HYPO|nr:ribosomal protein S27/S33, mitochondrial [Ophiocordyceps camponoti-floridani]
MSVPRARLLDLMKVQCQIFATTYNPDRIRMGNKILRQRLKGPVLAAYYPRKLATIKDVKREFGPQLTTWDDAEEERTEHIKLLKRRNKSAPKKKRVASTSAFKKKKG